VVGGPAGPAGLGSGACGSCPADRPVARQCAVADGEGRVAEEGDIREGPADARAAGRGTAEAADGPVVAEQTVTDGHGAVAIHDGTADTRAGERGTGAGRTADGLVIEERAIADGGGGRSARGPG